MTFYRNISRIHPKIIQAQKKLYKDLFSRPSRPRSNHNTKNEQKNSYYNLSNILPTKIPPTIVSTQKQNLKNKTINHYNSKREIPATLA